MAEKFDILVARVIAAGGTDDDLDALTELWQAEIAEQLPPLRARDLSAASSARSRDRLGLVKSFSTAQAANAGAA